MHIRMIGRIARPSIRWCASTVKAAARRSMNEHFTRRIVEMSGPESDHLLAYLTRWVHQPAFTVRYRWTAGTIAMWDNRFTQHYVINDFVGERVIERVTVMGDQVQGSSPRWRPWPEVVRGMSSMSRH